MGWKSTVDISRSEALSLIFKRINDASNEELSLILTELGYGDETLLPYFGHNLILKTNG